MVKDLDKPVAIVKKLSRSMTVTILGRIEKKSAGEFGHCHCPTVYLYLL